MRLASTLILLASIACGASYSAAPCSDGSACYQGPDGTSGVGMCRGGHARCDATGSTVVACEGQVLPGPETCNGVDDDCNGQVDDAIADQAPLCEEQTNACAGLKKPASLCAGGGWQPCSAAIYSAAVQARCDDGDACTVDSVSADACTSGCLHLSTCADRVDFAAVADTTIRADVPTGNYGSDDHLVVDGNSSTNADALVRFDPFAGGRRFGHVDRAYLTVSFDGANARAQAAPVLATWEEATATWSKPPGIGVSTNITQIPMSGTTTLVFDVSDIVRGWNDKPETNFGFALTTDPFGQPARFWSREGPPATRPKLTIIVNAKSVVLATAADTHVAEAQPMTSFGSAPDLDFTTGPQAMTYTRLLLEFGLEGLPANADVLEADVVLTQTSGQWLGPAIGHLVTAPWTEATATWNAFPSFAPAALGGVIAPDAFSGEKRLLLPGAVISAWKSGATPNDGIAIVNGYEGPAGASRTALVASRENATASSRPRLEVLYR